MQAQHVAVVLFHLDGGLQSLEPLLLYTVGPTTYVQNVVLILVCSVGRTDQANREVIKPVRGLTDLFGLLEVFPIEVSI